MPSFPDIQINGAVYQITASVFLFENKKYTWEMLLDDRELQAKLIENETGILKLKK